MDCTCMSALHCRRGNQKTKSKMKTTCRHDYNIDMAISVREEMGLVQSIEYSMYPLFPDNIEIILSNLDRKTTRKKVWKRLYHSHRSYVRNIF